ncbi:hypothetical protein ACFUG9_04800 [Streptomyces griseoincarnatus]
MPQTLSNAMSEAATLDSLGYMHHSIGQHEQAISYYERALGIRRVQEQVYQAEPLSQLAEAQIAAGRRGEVRQHPVPGLEKLEQFAPHDADRVRRRFREVDELIASRP